MSMDWVPISRDVWPEKLRVMQYNSRLLHPSAVVTDFGPGLHAVVRDLWSVLDGIPEGWGLSAIQCDIPVQVCVLDLKNGKDRFAMVNPVILESSGSIETLESCLSLKGLKVRVKRAAEVYVEFQDEHGEKRRIVATETLAVVIQHEIDHLAGRPLLQHVPPTRRMLIAEKYRKLAKQHERAVKRVARG